MALVSKYSHLTLTSVLTNLWKKRSQRLKFGYGRSKGTSSRKKVELKLKSVKNATQRDITDLNVPKWFSRYLISKSGIWARWTSLFCRFSAFFSLKYDVTDAMLQDNEKMKVQYLRNLLLDLF